MAHVKRGRTWQLFAIIVLLFIAWQVYLSIHEWIDITHLQQLGGNISDNWSSFTDETFVEIFISASLAGYVLLLWFVERRRQRAARGEARLSSSQLEANALVLELPATFHWRLSFQVSLSLWGCTLGCLAIIIIGGILSWLLYVGNRSTIVWEFPLLLSIVLLVCTGIPYLLLASFANHRLVIDETGISHTHLGRTQKVHWNEAQLFIHLFRGWYELSSEDAIVRWNKPSPNFPYIKTDASPEAIDALHMLIVARTGLPLYEL